MSLNNDMGNLSCWKTDTSNDGSHDYVHCTSNSNEQTNVLVHQSNAGRANLPISDPSLPETAVEAMEGYTQPSDTRIDKIALIEPAVGATSVDDLSDTSNGISASSALSANNEYVKNLFAKADQLRKDILQFKKEMGPETKIQELTMTIESLKTQLREFIDQSKTMKDYTKMVENAENAYKLVEKAEKLFNATKTEVLEKNEVLSSREKEKRLQSLLNKKYTKAYDILTKLIRINRNFLDDTLPAYDKRKYESQINELLVNLDKLEITPDHGELYEFSRDIYFLANDLNSRIQNKRYN